MNTGDVITIQPTELVAGGAALARVDGFPVFAVNVFPGDVARVELFEVKKGYARADLVELLTPGPWRRAAPCPVADECGGCDWTALRLDKQLEAKRRILLESLRRIGKITDAPEVALHASPLNYRLRSRLHRDGDAIGFYAMRSNRVVPLAKECEVVGFEALCHPREGEIWEVGDRITVENFTYRIAHDAFFQVNRHLLRTMLRLVSEHASRVKNKNTAVDLYAGVGFFSAPLARMFERVIAVEGSPASARCARENLPPNAKVIEAPVERYAAKLPQADFVFLDPPRAGTRQEVIRVIGERTKETIAHLSCDPVTFSRDASRLIASGWRLSTLDLLDLFPNTHHVETLASFERAQ
jgi:23S rRNA (uracil1939-C5)-methyltransferase